MSSQINERFIFPQNMFLVFLALKLCDKIDWSWVWVTSPLWIIFICLFIVELAKERKK